MGRPCSTSSRCTFLPCGPVCGVTSCIPKICFTAASASARVLHTFTPPPLPRPPAWICALTNSLVAHVADQYLVGVARAPNPGRRVAAIGHPLAEEFTQLRRQRHDDDAQPALEQDTT